MCYGEIVRLAEAKDIDELYEIYSHETVSPNMAFDPCSRSEFEDIYPEISAGGELLVRELNAEIVAVCKVVRRKRRLRHSAYIGSLAVKHSHQFKGVGKQFFSDIIDLLKKEGITRIELLVAADNSTAIRFFESFGFVVEGTHRNYFSRRGCDQLFTEHTMAWIGTL